MTEMMTPAFAAKIYAGFLLVVVAFQLALAFGVPWGSVSMGGKYPGVYPRKMRVAALCMIVFLMLIGAIVLIRAGLIYPEMMNVSRQLIWLVVAINSLGVLMNCITPSKWERIIWAPVTIVFLLTSVLVAIS